MSEVKVGTLRVHDRVLKYDGTVVSIANVSEATTFVPKPPFPALAGVLAAAGVLLALLSLGNMRGGGVAFLLVGLIVAGIGAVLIYQWYRRVQGAPKGLTLSLNSGQRMTVTFESHDVADRVMAAIEEAMQDGRVNQVFSLPNSIVIDSSIGNVGGLFKAGGK